MFKKEIWDKFTKFTFLEILKSPEGNEGDFEISKNERDNFFQNFTNKTCDSWFLVNHMWQSFQRAHKGKNYTKNSQSISINLIT